MKKPTEQQIKREIEILKEIRPKVRPFSAFGDDNWAKIDAEVKALEERMSIDATYDEWPEVVEEQLDHNFEIRNCAQDAIRWMDGTEKERPSAGWRPLMTGGR